MRDSSRWRARLYRELARSEHAAIVRCRSEARRLGASPPAEALAAICEHAEGQRPRLAHLLGRYDQKIGLSIGRAVGATIAALRHGAGAVIDGVADRMIDRERSYRRALLVLRRGLDTTRLLRDLAAYEHDVPLLRFCDEMLVDRGSLVERAEQALGFFAERPDIALASVLRPPLAVGRSLPDIVNTEHGH